MSCKQWLISRHNRAIQAGIDDEWYILSSVDYTVYVINYCPHCGSKLNKEGCTKND